ASPASSIMGHSERTWLMTIAPVRPLLVRIVRAVKGKYGPFPLLAVLPLLALLISLFPSLTVARAAQKPKTPAATAAAASTAQQHSVKQYTIEQFLDTVSVRGASFSADESHILFSSNKTGIFNAYAVPVTGGEPTPLTDSKTDTVFPVSYFPKDDRILLTRDQGGNELNHLYVRTPDGQQKDLTPGEKLKASFIGFTYDDAAFYVATNERDARYFDIYRYEAASYERTLFYKNEAGYEPAEVSNDGKWVALVKPNTTNDSDIYLWNADSKDTRHISEHQGIAKYEPATFDPASSFLYYRTDAGGEF